jgi:predicted RNA-binding protein Jag
MLLMFRGGGEYVNFIIDRRRKKLEINSSKTNYKTIETEWRNLFDKGKEEEQEKILDKLEDKDFTKAVELSMNKIGYKLFDTSCKCEKCG